MRMQIRTSLLFLLALPVKEASAIPAFARRYNVPCQYCHEGYPKLTALGEQFKARGFRMENESSDVSEWLKSVPIILRAQANQTFLEDGDSWTTTAFFKLVSAGNVGARVSYWVDQAFAVVERNLEGDDEHEFERVGTDNAWVRVELIPRKLYVRGGRFELDLPFSQARTPHNLAYVIYFANTGLEADNIGEAQDGGEVGGFLSESTRWSVAVVQGRNSAQVEELSDEADRFDGNVYGRIVYRSGHNRVGALAYFGRNRLALERNRGAVRLVREFDDRLLRLGADGSAWLKKVNLYGAGLYGRNSNAFGEDEASSFGGGFAQLDYHVRDDVVPTLRVNWLRLPTGPGREQESYTSVVPGVQIWFKTRVKLSAEVAFANRDVPTLGVIQVEVAF